MSSSQPQAIVREHARGCSVSTPRCDSCKKYFDSMKHKVYPYVGGGYHFTELSFHCTRCQNKLVVPEFQIEILNKFSEPSRESFNRILWQSPPNIKIEKKGDTFYPV